MGKERVVLSLNPDRQTLHNYESALQENGFEIVSVNAPIEARFEIEMGRCGVFLTSYLTPLPIYRDLASLFRRSCPGGIVVFLAQNTQKQIPDTDILLSDGDAPNSLLDRLRAGERQKQAAV